MKTSAVPQGGTRLVLVAITALVAAVLAALAVSSPASAAKPIGRDGRIHACYKVKGKQKGALRVVSGNRCRRGERRVAWLAAGPTGPSGPPGVAGSPGSSDRTAALEARIASLTLKLDALCTQTAALVSQANLLRGAIAGLSLNNVLTLLGGILNIPTLPVALPALACPTTPPGT